MTELRWLAFLRGGPSECFEDRSVQRVNVVLSRGVLALEARPSAVSASRRKTSQPILGEGRQPTLWLERYLSRDLRKFPATKPLKHLA